MIKYSAYNLVIESDIPLPLPVCQSAELSDIVVTTTAEIEEPENLSRTYDGVWYAYADDSLFLKWDVIGSFLIKDGKSIVVSEGINPPKASPVIPLLGTVMAVALHQRGLTALHGSSNLVDDKALVFLGGKGEGKSTMAAYLQKQGNALLSDDTCAIEMHKQKSPVLYPSFSRIKLWPDSMHYLDYTPEQHELVHPGYEKRNISLDRGFSYSPAPVSAIIVLATGPDVTLEPLSGHQAIPALIPHLIINRFPEHQPLSLVGDTYLQLVNVLKTIPLYQLTRPREISRLPAVAELVGGLQPKRSGLQS